MSEPRFKELDRDHRIWWGEKGNNIPAIKRFLSKVKQGVVPQTLWFYADVGHTQDAKKELIESVAFENSDNVLDSVNPPVSSSECFKLDHRSKAVKSFSISLRVADRQVTRSSSRISWMAATDGSS